FEDIGDLRVSGFHWFERRHYMLECNWKVFVDNYLDGGYHVPYLHKNLDRILDYAEYRIENGGGFCRQSSPVSTGGQALYYWIYPNLLFNCFDIEFDTNLSFLRMVVLNVVTFCIYFKYIYLALPAQN